jgi:hypothetical protein
MITKYQEVWWFVDDGVRVRQRVGVAQARTEELVADMGTHGYS